MKSTFEIKQDEFFAAAKSGDIETLKRLYQEERIDIHTANEEGQTAAHLAVLSDQKEVLMLLVSMGVDLNYVDHHKKLIEYAKNDGMRELLFQIANVEQAVLAVDTFYDHISKIQQLSPPVDEDKFVSSCDEYADNCWRGFILESNLEQFKNDRQNVGEQLNNSVIVLDSTNPAYVYTYKLFRLSGHIVCQTSQAANIVSTMESAFVAFVYLTIFQKMKSRAELVILNFPDKSVKVCLVLGRKENSDIANMKEWGDVLVFNADKRQILFSQYMEYYEFNKKNKEDYSCESFFTNCPPVKWSAFDFVSNQYIKAINNQYHIIHDQLFKLGIRAEPSLIKRVVKKKKESKNANLNGGTISPSDLSLFLQSHGENKSINNSKKTISPSDATQAKKPPQKIDVSAEPIITPIALVLTPEEQLYWIENFNAGFNFKNAKPVVEIDVNKIIITWVNENNEPPYFKIHFPRNAILMKLDGKSGVIPDDFIYDHIISRLSKYFSKSTLGLILSPQVMDGKIQVKVLVYNKTLDLLSFNQQIHNDFCKLVIASVKVDQQSQAINKVDEDKSSKSKSTISSQVPSNVQPANIAELQQVQDLWCSIAGHDDYFKDVHFELVKRGNIDFLSKRYTNKYEERWTITYQVSAEKEGGLTRFFEAMVSAIDPAGTKKFVRFHPADKKICFLSDTKPLGECLKALKDDFKRLHDCQEAFFEKMSPPSCLLAKKNQACLLVQKLPGFFSANPAWHKYFISLCETLNSIDKIDEDSMMSVVRRAAYAYLAMRLFELLYRISGYYAVKSESQENVFLRWHLGIRHHYSQIKAKFLYDKVSGVVAGLKRYLLYQSPTAFFSSNDLRSLFTDLSADADIFNDECRPSISARQDYCNLMLSWVDLSRPLNPIQLCAFMMYQCSLGESSNDLTSYALFQASIDTDFHREFLWVENNTYELMRASMMDRRCYMGNGAT